MKAAIKRRLPKPLRIAHTHMRLFSGLLVGLVAALLLPSDWRPVTRLLVGWDTAVAVYMVMSVVLMIRCTSDHINRRAEEDDDGAVALLLLTIVAAVASLAAIVIELGGIKEMRDRNSGLVVALAGATIVLSWLMIQTIFAFHYARAYYNVPGPGGAGLEFPDDDRPDYWDFIYFSFVVGMTFQVSDVQVTDKVMRRFVVAHGFVAFFFNVAILALTVNIGANLI